MGWLIWIGAAVSLAGLAGLVWSIIRVWSARNANLSEDELRAVVQKAMPINMAALFLSTIGLMTVIIGIFLK